VSLPAEVQFGREVLGELEAAETREWLVTNGLGGFASGTVAGTATRRYHGLLIAALQPPTVRTLLVSGLEESASYLAGNYPLATNRWLSGFVSPKGYLHMESFFLEGTKPVWRYALADALLEKRVWMKQGENTTYVQYSLVRASAPVELHAKALVGYRDFHATMQAQGWQMRIATVEQGLRVTAFDAATPFYLMSAEASIEPRHEWYHDYFLPAERERGLDDHEDRLYAGEFHVSLKPRESVTLVFSTEQGAALDGAQARTAQSNYEVKLFRGWQAKHAEGSAAPAEAEPGWLGQLVLAADQFVVKRTARDDAAGVSVIAGYPWFSDWGRDTMIALPGLTLAQGRPEVARKILKSFARYIDAGMLPNNFPDSNGEPQYNSVDAGLWYFEAVRQYFQATRDLGLLSELYPVLAGIVDAHVRGTRYHIKVDPADALLFAGGPGVQLTWMDAKIGDSAVTPRTGKAVEINALWINALHSMMGFARTLVRPAEGYAKLAEKAAKNFQKFWNAERHCCYDVVDVPGAGNDPALRPNQIFAVSLPFSPLAESQQKWVVDVVAQHLVTSHGLRSLAASEPAYQGKYTGAPQERDSAYHQGTVWGWLLGPFALAHFRVYGDRGAAQSFLEPLGRTIHSAGLGTISEIFGGDAPFPPAGCIAQAWSVAELFRAWEFLSMKRDISQKVVLQGC
jgi:predicted glycogen debranching enzyme